MKRTWEYFQGAQGHGEGHGAAHTREPHHDLHVVGTFGNPDGRQGTVMAGRSHVQAACKTKPRFMPLT